MIRTATKADSLGIAETQVESWQKTYIGQVPDDFLAQLSVPTRFRAWQERFSKGEGIGFVAEDNGRVVGFADFGPSRDPDKNPKVTGELYAIYLRPGTQRHGLGRELFGRGTEWLQSGAFQEMTTLVLVTNLGAISFYERMGMAHDGFEKPHIIGGRAVTEARYSKRLG